MIKLSYNYTTKSSIDNNLSSADPSVKTLRKIVMNQHTQS